jgi:hypothetical protein
VERRAQTRGAVPLSKNQRRIATILARIPPAREQLIAAIEEISPSFDLPALTAAAESSDPRERNRVSAIERQLEALVNWMDELASRMLDEGLRLGVLDKGRGTPWQRLVELGVIARSSAERLRAVKDTRDDLSHAYPPESWRALHAAANVVLAELDGYVARLRDWAVDSDIIPPADPAR